MVFLPCRSVFRRILLSWYEWSETFYRLLTCGPRPDQDKVDLWWSAPCLQGVVKCLSALVSTPFIKEEEENWIEYRNGKKSLPSGISGKELTCHFRRCRFAPWVRKTPWRRKWQPTPVFLPGKSHGQRCLVGYSSWGHKESDMTEMT